MPNTISMRAFPGVLKRDLEKFQRRIARAVVRAAKRSKPELVANTPKAFGELRDGINVVDTGQTSGLVAQLRVDAPHAQAVEFGADPHWVPIEALLKWVRLRFKQARGVLRQRQYTPKAGPRMTSQDRKYGPTSRMYAHIVKAQVKDLTKTMSEEQALRAIASSIQKGLANKKTRPSHFVKYALHTYVMTDLHDEISKVPFL
jgi:hypothetical protein